MSSDKETLKSLFNELKDFSFTDQLGMYERKEVGQAISNEADHLRECMQDGCSPLHPDFPEDIAMLTSHPGPLKTPIIEGQGELYSLLLTLIEAHAANAFNGRSDEFYGLLDRAKSIAIPDAGLPAQQVEPDLMLFSELFAEFIGFKINHENLTDRMQKEYRRIMDTLSEFINDKPANKITKKDIREWLIIYASLPVRNKKPYNTLPVTELLEMEIPDGDLVRYKTVEQVKKLLQGIFRYALDNDYLKVSPAVDLNLKFLRGQKFTYAPYSDSEVLKILEAVEKEKDPFKKWLPLVAAYTGARRGELVQLRNQDIKHDAEANRYYLDITDEAGSTKTKQSNRRVPLHNELLKAGFLDYVEKSSSDKLFDIEPNRLTNWFRDCRRKLEIPDCDDKGNRKVFHSFRHTVITRLKAANVEDSLQKAVVGHEIGDKSINQTTYTHLDTMPLSAFLPVIDVLEYKQI